MFNFLKKSCGCDDKGGKENSRRAMKQQEKKQMENQSSKAIDKTVEQSFPASDPPTNY